MRLFCAPVAFRRCPVACTHRELSVACFLAVSAEGSGAEMLGFSRRSIVIGQWPMAPVPSSLASRDIRRFDAIYQTLLG
jgi:hypothetical protein